MLICWNFKVWK